MATEEKGTELLNVDENGNVEKKEEEKPQKETKAIDYFLMVVFVLALAATTTDD